MNSWLKFRGLGTLQSPAITRGAELHLNLQQWIENSAHGARKDRVEVAHLRIKTRRNSSVG